MYKQLDFGKLDQHINFLRSSPTTKVTLNPINSLNGPSSKHFQKYIKTDFCQKKRINVKPNKICIHSKLSSNLMSYSKLHCAFRRLSVAFLTKNCFVVDRVNHFSQIKTGLEFRSSCRRFHSCNQKILICFFNQTIENSVSWVMMFSSTGFKIS